MAPGIVVSMDLPLAGTALESGLLVTEDNVESVRDRLTEELNRFKT